MKIVLAGASGAGKTTLAKALANELNLTFIEQSAGLIMLPDDKQELREYYGYNGNAGQRGVINKSHDEESSFGRAFQESVLRARQHILEEYKDASFVLDRSPLDPAVFWINQVAHNYPENNSKVFIKQCYESFIKAGITHLIKVDLNYGTPIEDNGSRVNNWYFQKKIDLLFDFIIDGLHRYISEDMDGGYKLNIARIPVWDWNHRLQGALDFISSTVPR